MIFTKKFGFFMYFYEKNRQQKFKQIKKGRPTISPEKIPNGAIKSYKNSLTPQIIATSKFAIGNLKK